MHAFDRRTDGQTDRQTDVDSKTLRMHLHRKNQLFVQLQNSFLKFAFASFWRRLNKSAIAGSNADNRNFVLNK